MVFGPEKLGAFANKINLAIRGKQLVTGFGAEMRKIDSCHRIVCLHPQDHTGGHALQPLSCLENRQRAKKPARVQCLIIIHIGQIGAMMRAVHRDMAMPMTTCRFG